MSESDPIRETRQRVEPFVIGLNMCPFAKAPALRDGIRYTRARGQTEEEILAELLHEAALLSEEDGPETSLLLLDGKYESFSAFLDFFHLAEALVDHSDFAETIQLVSFHPDYCFAGAPSSDPANATNRSPFPTIHLLRRDDVALAIASHPNIHQIPEDNQARLRGQKEA